MLTKFELSRLHLTPAQDIARLRETHERATKIVIENQDYRCTVEEDHAYELFKLLYGYTIVKESAFEFIGLSYYRDPSLYRDTHILYISKEANADGRYEVTIESTDLIDALTKL